jgi:hypothetical protein
MAFHIPVPTESTHFVSLVFFWFFVQVGRKGRSVRGTPWRELRAQVLAALVMTPFLAEKSVSARHKSMMDIGVPNLYFGGFPTFLRSLQKAKDACLPAVIYSVFSGSSRLLEE